MTFKGPFQPKAFYDSVCRAGNGRHRVKEAEMYWLCLFIFRIQCTASQKLGCFPMHYPVQFEMTRAVNQHFPWQLARMFSSPTQVTFPVSLFQLITSFCLAEGK